MMTNTYVEKVPASAPDPAMNKFRQTADEVPVTVGRPPVGRVLSEPDVNNRVRVCWGVADGKEYVTHENVDDLLLSEHQPPPPNDETDA